MKRHTLSLILSIAISAALVFAQGPTGNAGMGQRANPGRNNQNNGRSGAGLSMAQLQVVEGTVTSVQIAAGIRYPSLVVNNTQIKVAPAWYLLENDFTLAVGATVRITAAPSLATGDAYLYAIDITKLPSGVKITLRSATGTPLWFGAAGSGGNRQAPRTGGACIDPATAQTVSGVIESVTAGAGIKHPELVLLVDGKLFTFELGPERVLLASDLELKVGATLTVKYALCTCDGDYVALELTDVAGNTLILRDNNGMCAWNN
jgi:hypothetical protein